MLTSRPLWLRGRAGEEALPSRATKSKAVHGVHTHRPSATRSESMACTPEIKLPQRPSMPRDSERPSLPLNFIKRSCCTLETLYKAALNSTIKSPAVGHYRQLDHIACSKRLAAGWWEGALLRTESIVGSGGIGCIPTELPGCRNVSRCGFGFPFEM